MSQTGIVFDEQMCAHSNLQMPSHPESPDRLRSIWSKLNELGLAQRCLHLPSRLASSEEIESVHTHDHVVLMDSVSEMQPRRQCQLSTEYNSIYFNSATPHASRLAAGCLNCLTEEVVKGTVKNGVAVIRPPGHHAETDQPMGFCIYNNVAIAAKLAREKWGAQRVLIVDWDVHHGNGTQNMFEEDPTILYFSTHRYDHGMFYPGSVIADPSFVGKGRGCGYTVNVGWNERGIGDKEYILAFMQVLMPIAWEFNPDLVLISAGFDAAIRDPLGGCNVTPRGYGVMTHMLTALAGGKIVIALEGGYNLSSISASMAACVGVLLGDPVPDDDYEQMGHTAPIPSAIESIQATIAAHLPYWKYLIPPPQPIVVFKDTVTTTASTTLDDDDQEEELLLNMSHMSIDVHEAKVSAQSSETMEAPPASIDSADREALATWSQ